MLPKDTWHLLQRPNHQRAGTETIIKHILHRTIRRSPGNCKAAKSEMVRARDNIGRPNQSDSIGNGRRQSKKGQAEKELDRQHRGVDRKILR